MNIEYVKTADLGLVCLGEGGGGTLQGVIWGTLFTYLQQKHSIFFVGCVQDILKGPFKYCNDSVPKYPCLYIGL